MSHRLQIPAAFILLCLIVTLPILLHPYLPLTDLPNHIARLYIAAHPDNSLSAHYSYEFDLTPNSAMDLIWYYTGYPVDVVLFFKIMALIYPINFVASIMVLSRVVQGRWTLWPLASVLLVYNSSFYFGFMNYLVSIPFAIYFLALWLAIEKAPNWQRIGLFIPLALLLFFMHLFALIFLAVAVFGREIERVVQAGGHWKKTLANNILLCIPFILPVILMFAAFTDPDRAMGGSKTEFGSLIQRVAMVLSPFAVEAHVVKSARALSCLLTAFVVFAALSCFRREKAPQLILAPRLKGPLVAVFILTIATPYWLNNVGYLHIRFPFVFIAMLFAAGQWRGLKPRLALGLAVIVLATLSFRAWGLNTKIANFSADITHLKTALSELPPDSRLQRVERDIDIFDEANWQIIAYAIPMVEVFVPTLFRGTHGLTVNSDWSEYIDSIKSYTRGSEYLSQEEQLRDPEFLHEYLFWRGWQSHFSHLLLTDGIGDKLIGWSQVELLVKSGPITIFRVKNPSEIE